jgi:hypothetical protein
MKLSDASQGSSTSIIQKKGEPVSEDTAEQPSVPETPEKPFVLILRS